MREKRKTFSNEFKDSDVQMVLTGGKNAAQVLENSVYQIGRSASGFEWSKKVVARSVTLVTPLLIKRFSGSGRN